MKEEVKKAFDKSIEILQQYCDEQTCEKIAYACIDNILSEINVMIQLSKREKKDV